MQLSRRMQRLASLVTEGNRLADVGTDHGYIPIALIKDKKVPSAVAMDVNEGPLVRAREHVRESGLSTYIELRLSDGLAELKEGEADTVLIAGMGGMLTIRILEEGRNCLNTVKELVLQPQSDIYRVRKWLSEHGYLIEAEDIVEEDGKYYPMMKAVHGQERELEQSELFYGKTDVQRSVHILYDWLLAEHDRKRKVMETLQRNAREHTQRGREIAADMERIVYCCQKIGMTVSQ